MFRPLLIEKSRSAFWLVPAVISIGIVCLLPILTQVEAPSQWFVVTYLLSDLSAEGARAILTSIATSLMTVVGVLLSISVVVLQQASAQYSPRVIENFIQSRVSQSVFGFFIGSFVYSLLLVRKIPETLDQGKLPQVATAFSVVLAIFCFAFLIKYINHIMNAIKSTTIIDAITRNSLDAMSSWESSLLENEKKLEAEPSTKDPLVHEFILYAPKAGYLQGIDWVRFAETLPDPWRIELLTRPGEFIQRGVALMHIRSGEIQTEDRKNRLHSHIFIGHERTHSQDVRFGVRQLVDVALRALSPSLNDPTTAEEAMNGIESLVLAWSNRKIYGQPLKLDGGIVTGFEVSDQEFARLALEQILRSGKDFPSIAARAKAMVDCVESCSTNERMKRSLREVVRSFSANATQKTKAGVAAGPSQVTFC